MSRGAGERGIIPLHDELIYPGHGMPDRAQNLLEPLSPFGRIAKGQPLGKSVNLLYDALGQGQQLAADSMFELRGDDIDACQLQVTLTSPLAIPRDRADLGYDLQNQTGGFPNSQLLDAAQHYPGTSAPIIWPQFIAIVRWGVGGARATAEVDFVNGTVINVPASAVDVFAAVPVDAANVPGTSGLYQLSAFICPGYPRSGNAQRTVYVGALAAAAESDIYPVPAFGKDVTVNGCDDSATANVTVATIRFWQSPDGTGNLGNFLVSGNQPMSFRVPNGAAYFTIVNGMGVTALFSACYALAI